MESPVVRRGAISIVLVALVALGLFAWCRPKPTPLPHDVTYSLDSAKATKPAFDSGQNAAKRHADSTVRRIATDSATLIARAVAEAARWRKIADSATAVAKARDAARDTAATAPPDDAWKTAALARAQEADSLKVVVDVQADDLAKAHATIIDLSAKLTEADLRVAASETPTTGLNDRLAKAATDGDHCRVLHFFGCLTRKASFASGIATDELLRLAYRERAKFGITVSF